MIMESPSHFENFNALPSPDGLAAIQLHELFSDPDHDLERIVEFISSDPSLAAETLKRCNRGLPDRGEPITDVFEAVSHLGYYELYGIVAAAIGSRTPSPAAPEASQRASSDAVERKFSGSHAARKSRQSYSNGDLYS